MNLVRFRVVRCLLRVEGKILREVVRYVKVRFKRFYVVFVCNLFRCLNCEKVLNFGFVF